MTFHPDDIARFKRRVLNLEALLRDRDRLTAMIAATLDGDAYSRTMMECAACVVAMLDGVADAPLDF